MTNTPEKIAVFSMDADLDYAQFDHQWFWQIKKPAVDHRFLHKDTITKLVKKEPNVPNLVSINEYRKRGDKVVSGDYPFDLDVPKENLNPDQTAKDEDVELVLQDTIRLYDHLAQYLPPEAMEIYFSGRRGFGIILKKESLGIVPSAKLNFYFKHIVIKLNDIIGVSIDDSIYGDGKLLRLPNSKHDVTGLYRICLRPTELHNMTLKEMKQLAKKPREFTKAYLDEDLKPVEEAVIYFQGIADTIRYVNYSEGGNLDIEIKALEEHPPCIKDLLANGIRGANEENHARVAVATYFKAKGKTLQETMEICREFQKNISSEFTGTPLAKRTARSDSGVRSIYESKIKEYAFSCPPIWALTKITCDKTQCPLHKSETMLQRAVPGLGTMREGAAGYEVLRKSDLETHWDQINNFLIKFDKIIHTEEEILYQGKLTVDGKKEYNFTWEPEILADGQKFRQKLVQMGITGVFYHPRDLGGILMLANYFGTRAERAEGLDSVGCFGDKFVTPSLCISEGKIEKNEKFPILNLKTSIDKYDFIDAPEESCAQAAEFIIETLINFHSKSITLPLLGEVGRCPLIPKIGNMRYITYMEGMTGAGKTLVQKAFLNFYFPMSLEEKNSEYKKQAMATMNDTPPRVEFHGHFLINVPYIWDDFKTGLTRDPEKMITIIQNYYDQTGRGRMTREIKERKAYWIRANLWANGEQIPDRYASAQERCLIYRMKKSKLRLDLKDEIERKKGLLRGITPHYIRWTQEKGAQIWKGKFNVAHARLVPYAEQNMTGLNSFLCFLKEKGWLSSGKFEELMEKGVEAMNAAIKLTKTSSEAESTVSTFVEGIRELLQSTCVLGPEPEFGKEEIMAFRSKTQIGEDRPNTGNSETDGLLDEETKGQAWIFPQKTLEQIAKLHLGKIAFSKNSLGRDLLEREYLVETRKSGSPSVNKRLKNSNVVSVWVFNRKKLLEDLDEEG